MMYDFTGQTVLVTGGTRGIGAAISSAFLKAGAQVIAVFGGNVERAEQFKVETGELADRLELVQLDVSDFEAVKAWFDGFETAERKLDVLVNNAGIRKDSILALMGHKEWQRVIDVNLTGCYSMCKFALMNMTPNRYGRIINITSPSGQLGFPGQGNYAASKAGMIALTKSVAKEVARRKITANCVSPGFIETELIDDLPEEIMKAHKKSVPMQRFGTVDEIAHAVQFLACKESSYVTGAVLEVTGGIL
jgi:3-oxoacyl-[acyl-carrier protein] reductase